MAFLIISVVFILIGCSCFFFKERLSLLFEKLEQWSQNVGPNKYILYRFKAPMKAKDIEHILKLLGAFWLIFGILIMFASSCYYFF